jgi:hypothetical protein
MFFLSGVDALRFRGNNTNEYGIFVGPSQSLTSFAACFWMKTTEDSDKSILSYSYRFNGTEPAHGNGILIYLEPDLRIIFEPFGTDSSRTIRYKISFTFFYNFIINKREEIYTEIYPFCTSADSANHRPASDC